VVRTRPTDLILGCPYGLTLRFLIGVREGFDQAGIGPLDYSVVATTVCDRLDDQLPADTLVPPVGVDGGVKEGEVDAAVWWVGSAGTRMMWNPW
jgi:hypothetical protein